MNGLAEWIIFKNGAKSSFVSRIIKEDYIFSKKITSEDEVIKRSRFF